MASDATPSLMTVFPSLHSRVAPSFARRGRRGGRSVWIILGPIIAGCSTPQAWETYRFPAAAEPVAASEGEVSPPPSLSSVNKSIKRNFSPAAAVPARQSRSVTDDAKSPPALRSSAPIKPRAPLKSAAAPKSPEATEMTAPKSDPSLSSGELAFQPIQPAAALAAAPNDALAGVEEKLTLEEVVSRTLGQHPLLKARSHDVDIARAALVTASLLPNPSFVLDTESPVNETGNTQLSTRLTFTLPTGPRRRYEQLAAHAGIHRAEHALSRETLAVLQKAVSAAIEVQYLQEQTTIQAEIATLAQNAARLQRQKAAQELASEADILIAEADAAQIEFDRLQGLGQLEAARLRLGAAMGVSSPRPFSMDGKLDAMPVPPVPLEVVLQTARDTRPEIAEAQAAVTQAQRELSRVRASARPDLQFGPRFQDDIGRARDTMGVRMQIDLPVFDRKQGDIQGRAAEVRVREATFALAELTSLQDVAAAYSQLAPIQATMEYYRANIEPLLERTREAMVKAEVADAIDPYKMSDQLRKLNRMRLGELDARYLYNQVKWRLELFLGQRLENLTSSPGAAADAPPEPTSRQPDFNPLPSAPERLAARPATSGAGSVSRAYQSLPIPERGPARAPTGRQAIVPASAASASSSAGKPSPVASSGSGRIPRSRVNASSLSPSPPSLPFVSGDGKTRAVETRSSADDRLGGPSAIRR